MKKRLNNGNSSEAVEMQVAKTGGTTRMKWELDEEQESEIVIPPLSGVWSIRNDCQIGQWKAEETPIGTDLPMIVVDVTFGRGLIPPVVSAKKYYESLVSSKEKPEGFSPSWFALNAYNQVEGIAKPQEVLNAIFENQVKDWAFVWFIPAKKADKGLPERTLCGTFVKSTSLSRNGTGLIEYLESLKVHRKNPLSVITNPQFRPTHKNPNDGKDCLGLVWDYLDVKDCEPYAKETMEIVNQWMRSLEFSGNFLIPEIASQWVECTYLDLKVGNEKVEKELALRICSSLGVQNPEREVDIFLGLDESMPWDSAVLPFSAVEQKQLPSNTEPVTEPVTEPAVEKGGKKH